MLCTTQPQAKKKISRSTQKGGAQQDLVVHPRAPSHHQAHAVVLAPSATLGSTPELIDAEVDWCKVKNIYMKDDGFTYD
jgi:hypothetical protein